MRGRKSKLQHRSRISLVLHPGYGSLNRGYIGLKLNRLKKPDR